MRSYIQYKKIAVSLRNQGQTYGDIQSILNVKIPKSTLWTWCREIAPTENQKNEMILRQEKKVFKGRMKALRAIQLKKRMRFNKILIRYQYLKNLSGQKDFAKAALALLYLCEGSKRDRGTCCFANSDPKIISLFLKLLRKSYKINEKKFRCTVQCRADQDPDALAKYWSAITNIPLPQFYKPQIDKRTIGKPTLKLDYKGVCRIDYFSANIYNELRIIGSIL